MLLSGILFFLILILFNECYVTFRTIEYEMEKFWYSSSSENKELKEALLLPYSLSNMSPYE